jgi:hypothetical protein
MGVWSRLLLAIALGWVITFAALWAVGVLR